MCRTNSLKSLQVLVSTRRFATECCLARIYYLLVLLVDDDMWSTNEKTENACVKSIGDGSESQSFLTRTKNNEKRKERAIG